MAKYALLNISDVRLIVEALKETDNERLQSVRSRLASETGGDFQEIADRLKTLHTCPACSIEGQEHSCVRIAANFQGRRLKRLIDRANHD